MEMYFYQPDNSQREVQLRRWRDVLAISGSAVIALSLWDVLKLFIDFFLGENSTRVAFSERINEITAAGISHELLIRILAWIVLLSILLLGSGIIFLFHFYIGINAWRAGRQTAKKKKRGYLILTFFALCLSAFLIIYNLQPLLFKSSDHSPVETSTFFFEIVQFFYYLSLLIAAAKIRKLERIGEDSYDDLAKN